MRAVTIPSKGRLELAERPIPRPVDDQVLIRVAAAGLDTEISVKPTHLGLDVDPALASANLLRLVDAANDQGRWVWIASSTQGLG